MLGQVPRETSIGLMAYGHREKGNCADIELLIGPAPAAAAETPKEPKEPGNYVLRYWNADSDVALAARAIAVE